MTSFPNWRLFSWQLGEDAGKTFLWLSGQPTVSAAASPERWGIQDSGWETAFFQQILKPDLVKTVLLSRLRYLWSTDWRSCLEASHFQNFHLFTAMVAASSDVNKWKRNLTQEMLTEPEDESEPAFETSFRFQQEGDIVAVYNVENFFISEVTRVISEEESIVNFLEKAAVKMELLRTGGHALKITLKSLPQLCLPRICNLHLQHCLDVCSLLNLPGIYLADIKHSDAV